jgi:hypothetical protein
MVPVMPLYKKIIIIFSNTIFRLLLFFTISIIAAVIIYTDKTYVPSVFTRNNVYERVVGALLETNKEQTLTAGGQITLEDPEIQKIIIDAFPAEELENYSNEIIEGIYAWLEQNESELSFTIDLTKNKQRLAESLSTYAINRIQKLPFCTEFPDNIDPFSATCQPPNMNYVYEQISLEEQLLNDPGFLSDTIITEQSIFGDSKATSSEGQYRNLPIYYELARLLPVYIVLVLLLLALIVIFTSSTKKIGMRKIGKGLIGAGSSLIVFTYLFSFVVPSATGSIPLLQSSGNGIDRLLSDVTLDFGQDYSWMIIKISAPLVIIGILMVAYAQTGRYKKDYNKAKLKSGVISSNEQKNKSKSTTRQRPPIQSSEASDTKPKRKLVNKKYRKIPKKEL